MGSDSANPHSYGAWMHIAWNDLQTIEALVRLGTVEGAARALGLTHSSVSRRLVALEAQLTTSLFVRGARLVPGPLARQLAEQAKAMQVAAAAAEALVALEQRRREERTVITTNDVLAPLLFRAIATLTRPIDVDVIVGDAELTLGPGQVDLALRPAVGSGDGLRGRRLGQLQLGVFAVDEHDPRWVLPDEALRARRSMRWWRRVDGAAPHVVTCNTLLGIRDACAAGLGRAIVPAFLFHGDARVRCLKLLDEGPPVWLLTPTTTTSTKAARALRAAVAAALIDVEGAFVA